MKKYGKWGPELIWHFGTQQESCRDYGTAVSPVGIHPD